jgi:hypothetical protein
MSLDVQQQEDSMPRTVKVNPSSEDPQRSDSINSLLAAHSPLDPEDPPTKVDYDEGIQELLPEK